MTTNKDRVIAAAVLLVSFAVFRFSPVRTVYDSRYEMMFAQQLLWHHSFSLDAHPFAELRLQPGQVYQGVVDLDYHLVQVGARFYYLFPPGSVILSIPYVALANAFGISATDQNGVYDHSGEIRIEAGLAALLMASFSVIIFLTSRLLLPRSWSLLITVAVAFGTQVWSTASRAVWSHTWGILILALAIWSIVQAEIRNKCPPPLLLGTLLSWLYFVRPVFAISIAAIGLYLLLYHRKIFIFFVLTGCAWLFGLIVYSEYHFGRLQPVYYSSGAPLWPVSSFFWRAFAVHLISPARGLFVYVPLLAFVVYVWIRYVGRWKSGLNRLGRMAGMVILVHLVFISFFATYGGHCYGARLTADLVPWIALLAILGVEGRLRWHEENRARDSAIRMSTEAIVAALLLVSSVVINGLAAVSSNVWWWNVRPTNIDEDAKRLWDWRHPQFLSAFEQPEQPDASP